MIYLIESAGMRKEKDEIIFFRLLKIGYTSESNRDSRLLTYKMHNPSCIVLHEYPGTEDNERALHLKFRDYKFPEYGREWFNWDQSIIDYFNEVNPLDFDLLEKTVRQRERFNSEIYDIVTKLYRSKLKKGEYQLGNWIGDTVKDVISKNFHLISEVIEYLGVDEVDNELDRGEVDLKEIIQSNFYIGMKIPYSAVTEKMKYLYSEYNISGPIKHKDILNYFECGLIKIAGLKGYHIIRKL